jgi:hypothetical protein
MRVLLGWLVDFAWLSYAACALGAVVYIARAISLQRRLGASLTVFERETTGTQVARLWRVATFFVAVGVTLFAVQVYLLPQIPVDELAPTTPTLTGLLTVTPSPTSTATRIAGVLPTITVTVPAAPVPPVPTPEAAPVATPESTPEPAPSVPVGIRFGDVAELVGYDLSTAEVQWGQPLGLALYWRALDGAAAADYVVFTHLRSEDGRIIAQHDGVPGEGVRSTTGWLPGELIVDYHGLVFTTEGGVYAGPAQVAVGLYRAAAPESRVPVQGGVQDYVLLETQILVVAP